MRRLSFRLIVPDGPLRRFRLPEDFGDQHASTEESALRRGAGIALAWCGLSAGCWLLAQGHLLPGLSLDPLLALSGDDQSRAWAAVVPATNGAVGAFDTRAVAHPRSDGAITSNTASAPPAVYPSAAAIRRDLPQVSYEVSVLHKGGEWGHKEAASITAEPPQAPRALDDELNRDDPRTGSRTEAQFRPIGEVRPVAPTSTRPLVTPESIPTPARESRATSVDPFEADFIKVRPTFSLPSREPARDDSELQPVEVTSAKGVPRASSTSHQAGGGPFVLHTGGGCEAAFNASNQSVNVGKTSDKEAVGSDASSADYTAVLSRLNVLACHPPSPLSVQVCVAVSERRAVGVTVTTSPGNAAVASCIARQISGLRFPASTGADLVRSRFDLH